MDRDANYVAVGAFVLLVTVLGLAFVFWYTDARDQRSYQRYEIYFRGSVSGLSAGSPVRYLGVDVGKVVRVRLDPAERKRVQVIADVDADAPIDGRSQAALRLQGVTGLLYVDLQQDPTAPPSGTLAQGERYPVIRSVPSDFDVLISSLPALATHAIALIDHFNGVFDERNVEAIRVTLDNVRIASERLPSTLNDIDALVADARRTTRTVTAVAEQLRALESQSAPQINTTLANAERITDKLADTSDRLDRFMIDSGPELIRFTHEGLPEIESLLRESRGAVRDFRELSHSLKQDPSQILYEPNRGGVEVPR